jgi:CRP-like cAMP-binding protein
MGICLGAPCSFFKALLSEALRLEVCRHLCHKKLGATRDFEQGDIGDDFYVIVSGSVSVRRMPIDDKVVLASRSASCR